MSMDSLCHYAYLCTCHLSILSPESCAILVCCCKVTYNHLGIVFMGYEQKINFILGQSLDLKDQSAMQKIKDLIKALLDFQEGRYGVVSNTVCIATVNFAIAKLSAECNASKVIWKMIITSLDKNDRLEMKWSPLQEKDLKFEKAMRGRFGRE